MAGTVHHPRDRAGARLATPRLITTPPQVDVDDCQALVWRTSLLLDPIPDAEPEPADTPAEPAEHVAPPPFDPSWADEPAPFDPSWADEPAPTDTLPPDPADDSCADQHWTPDAAPVPSGAPPAETAVDLAPDLALTLEALQRRGMTPPDMAPEDLNAQLDRADAWRASRQTPERLAAINDQALDFYQACYRGSWAQPYLAERFGADLTGDPHIPTGADARWRTLDSLSPWSR